MHQITLPSSTKSDLAIPDKAEFNRRELDALIEKYSPILEADEILSVNVSTLPSCEFLHDDDSLWYEDDCWEQTITQVGKHGVTLLFAHKYSGEELFFEYIKKEGINQNA